MARISELHYSNAYARSSGVSEFLEVSLSATEDASDFSVVFYNQDGNAGLTINLGSSGLTPSWDAASQEWVWVLSADDYDFLLTDPDSNASNNYEAAALVDVSDGTVLDFYDIGGGTQNIIATDGLAAGAVSETVAVPTGPNAATYTLQFNQPNPTTPVYEAVSAGSSGTICFAEGTLIKTPDGERPVETLAVGAKVLTVDSGARAIRWTGARRVPAEGKLAPVRIAAGTLGCQQDLRVSPQHRILIDTPEVELKTGNREALVAATHLVDGRTVTREPGGTVTYFHFMFDGHELVWANGAVAESFFVSEHSLKAMPTPMREEFSAIFPELVTDAGEFGEAARPILRGWEARGLNVLH
ncbi:Hint domain-containing protein [Tropicimonas sp. TH_r6]|uniref:Hint domain-containing protein n=1 Tax=Tropicimonas sp. TH_r6 TaxID=3082085 RepID=UPI002954D732|nr:Hint domain-containing protein [Tropicimonas sp. TH_r6]MDV7144677.1 Hint domain-containing protein [Tropicimonas sp. TH_r6]